MALYGPAVKRLIPPGPTDPRITPRIVILHVDAGNASSLYDWFNGPSGGVESHFFVKKNGVVEQYRDTGWQADANTDANDWAISIETQGFEAGEWTPEQLASIKALILWCHEVHGIPLQRCSVWDGAGIGYHTLFPGRWDKRGASCPGPERKLQFNQIITPWLATAESEDIVTPDDIKAIADEVLKRPVKDLAGNTLTVGQAIGITLRNTGYIAQLEKASVDKIAAAVAAKVGTGATADAIAKALLIELTKETP